MFLNEKGHKRIPIQISVLSFATRDLKEYFNFFVKLVTPSVRNHPKWRPITKKEMAGAETNTILEV